MTTAATRDEDLARNSRRGFVLGQVRGLQPLEFVTFVAHSGEGHTYVEVSRDELEDFSIVEVGGVPSPGPKVRAELEAMGFAASEPEGRLRWKGTGADAVTNAVTAVLDGPLAVAADAPLDVRHGSRRAEVELARKLTRVRKRIRAIVDTVAGRDAVVEDEDGDYVFAFESTRVWTGTRVLASTEIVVRVFALAAVDVDPSPTLGLFLAQANFALAIGKFSLDAAHRAVWFEEALLGEAFSDDELHRIIELIAVTTNEYDDQIARMFGGRTAREAATSSSEEEQHEKPGTSGYL